MGSSESDNTGNGNTCCASEPTGVQESSIFGDISNLSPAPPLKDAAILQGFAGMTSPPNVFTSPHINPQPSFLNRQQQCHTSSSGFSVDNVKLEEVDTPPYDPETLVSQLNIAVKSLDQNVAVEKLLDAPLDREFIDSGSREHLDDAPKSLESNTVKEDSMKDNCLTSETSTILLKRADECRQREYVAGVDQIKDENYRFYSTSEVCSDLNSKPFTDPDHDQPIYGDSLNEVSHIQTDVLRRGLQFGECQHRSIRSNPDYSTERQISIADSSQNFIPETPCNRHVAVQSESASTMRFRSCTSIAVSKPRGIGLHLNSVVASPPGGLVTGKQSSKGMVKLEGKSLIRSGIVNSCAVSSNNVEKFSSITEGDMHQSESVEMVTPNKLLLANSAKPLDSPILLSSAGEEMAESTAVLNELGSNTGRAQASGSINGDGCKRCSCKKSKCLKLYCDCFAAGLYCVDSCSCKGCFNRPEFKDTVLEARQQIESRNPLAFAPRIMQHVTNSPTNSGESAESVVPSSLRHKRGCNCRKSMCLKKYCECYQANVGCSDGCRCEGCKNVYGKKPDYGMSRHIINKRTFDEISEEIPDHKRKLLITSRSHVSLDKVVDSPVAVPITPALPCSDSRKNEMKSLLPGRRYVLSPEPNLHTPPGIHRSSSGSSLVQHGSRNPTKAIPLTSSVPVGLVNLCHVTRLSNPLQTTDMAPSSNARDVQEAPPPSPIREIARSKTPEYLHASGYCGWPGDDTMDNDTPAILRDSPAPVKSVKVSSPNKKRISPPHNRLNKLRPMSCGEVRSSRKYIFRSVPKFPSLSPCLGSKDPSERPADTHHRSINP